MSDDYSVALGKLFASINGWDVKEEVQHLDLNFAQNGDNDDVSSSWEEERKAYEEKINGLESTIAGLKKDVRSLKKKLIKAVSNGPEDMQKKKVVKRRIRSSPTKEALHKVASSPTTSFSPSDPSPSSSPLSSSMTPPSILKQPYIQQEHQCNCDFCTVKFNADEEANNPFTRKGRKWTVSELKAVIARFRVQLRAKDDALRQLSLYAQGLATKNRALKKENADQLSELYKLHREL